MTPYDVIRNPDRVMVETEDETLAMSPRASQWGVGSIELGTNASNDRLTLQLSSPEQSVKRLHIRWNQLAPSGMRVLGDHWERGYGDFEWRGIVPERMMPWYVLCHSDGRTQGIGVQTGGNSLAAWRIDSAGISLWLDIRAGGVGVELGQRQLEVATVMTRIGEDGQSAFDVHRGFCRTLCDSPRMPEKPVYGSNNWYYAYGQSSHDEILRDTDLVVALSPDGENRPFMVIDDGWQIAHDPSTWFNGGPWHAGNDRFPNMANLAERMAGLGAQPGIWFRPLWTRADVPESWLFPADRMAGMGVPRTLDPSIPEVLDQVRDDVSCLAGWGYRLIKHDFSTFDICGRWGFAMHVDMTPDGWSFADRSRTTAEVMKQLYKTIQDASADALILGCNTVGHLAAGLESLQRTGDDTSGLAWERTRQRGINTLAFRAAQQGTFFAADADCVGLTDRVPWSMNRQWLDLVARSGTPLFVSAQPSAVGPEQASALKSAFAAAAMPQAVAEPIDWMDTTCPSRYRIDNQEVTYDWFGEDGISFSFA